jgi:nucleotide-binding universal stress UspA family protein
LEVAEDEQVDMIVMSTHGRSGLEELAEGSTALGLIRAGKFPVTLVQPDL